MAFFGFLSLFPIIAAILTYGLIADPGQMREQVRNVSDALPQSARHLLMQQVSSLVSTRA